MNFINRFTSGETILVPVSGRGRIDPTVVLGALQKEICLRSLTSLRESQWRLPRFGVWRCLAWHKFIDVSWKRPGCILYYEERGRILSQFCKLYQHLEDANSTLLRNVSRFLPDYMTSHLRRQLSAKSVCSFRVSDDESPVVQQSNLLLERWGIGWQKKRKQLCLFPGNS